MPLESPPTIKEIIEKNYTGDVEWLESPSLVVIETPKEEVSNEIIPVAKNDIEVFDPNKKLSKEEATKRMKLRGRADDTEEGIANRIAE